MGILAFFLHLEAFMNNYRNDHKELTPIKYSATAIKVLHFERPSHHKCFRFHWHDRMELIRVHEGGLYINHGTQLSYLKSGELLFVPPHVPHRGYTEEGNVKYDVLMFDIRSFYNDSDICQTYFPALYDGRAKFQNVMTHPDIIQCFDTICKEWESDSLEITANIYRLLALFFKHNLLELRAKITRDNTVSKIVNYIETHFSQDISTATLCEYFGYTATHLGRKFKEETGLSPMNYIKIYRMEVAYKLLKSGKRNVSEIAMQCGYPDPNYFTRCFKNHFGVAPSQLKK